MIKLFKIYRHGIISSYDFINLLEPFAKRLDLNLNKYRNVILTR